MIILDENLQDRRIREAIARWYPGQVLFIRNLRPGTIIKDDAVSSLLQQAAEPTFVTINTDDFWLNTRPSRHYCILTFELPKERSLEIPRLTRLVLQFDLFKAKATRMGKVIRWTPTRIEYYEADRRVIQIEN
jgi:hypothetical protein